MRTIPDPGFPDDDGSVVAELTEALAAYDAEPATRHAATLAVLQRHRLLVPVVAVLGETEDTALPDGRRVAQEKSSDMATVLMRGRDGRLALLAFTGIDAMRRWDPAARPVPVDATTAAAAATQDDAAAVLVDVAGPVTFVVEADDLAELAAGHVLVELSDGFAWVRPDR